jgi:diaminohydroxyphosphoribosylaminopyrimidine deaminase/5-amino-6-(5-phosphoribosylamino)uracil reductase
MKTAFSDDDRRHMREALRLAERGRGFTRPNPVVGAILVQSGKVVARGFHRRAGLPHAEIETLAKMGMRAPGATLYVTLEPCCHQGRTGPCTEAILGSGVKRVVVGCCDENPLVSGRGIALLRRAGLRVDAGCLKDECHQQNRVFFTWIRSKRPSITMKVASTLDGFIGDRREKHRKGNQRWITGKDAREFAHGLRAQHDAILVGVETILTDDPRLTVRLNHQRRRAEPDPLCVVLDSRLRTKPSSAFLCQSRGKAPLIVAAKPAQADLGLATRQRKLEAAGAEIVFVAATKNGRVALPALLRMLAGRDVQSLLVEGGSRIHGAFIGAGLVDSLALFLAPRLVGSGVPIVEGVGLDWRSPAKLGPISVRSLGDDVLLTADVIAPGQRHHRQQ